MKRWLALLMVFFLLPFSALAEAEFLSPGDSGEQVRTLQERLNAVGLNAGKADGIYGSRTKNAVKEAQRLLMEAGHSLTATGHADPKTLELLFDPENEYALLTLRKGSKGNAVRELQTRLIDLKLLSGNADGDYGSATEAAVQAFQQKMKELGAADLPTDGSATPPVMQLLMSDLRQYGFRAPIYFNDAEPLALIFKYKDRRQHLCKISRMC